MNPSARKQLIADLIRSTKFSSQEDLLVALKKRGVGVTQTTVSRDLVDLGAMRGKDESGRFRYVLGGFLSQKASRPSHLLLSVDVSGNLVVAKTPPGGAQLLAGQIDAAISSGVLGAGIGSIAGDDTVIIVARTPALGNTLAKEITALVDGESSPTKKNRSK
jgi:transcriptional regulator of arginine metabolism